MRVLLLLILVLISNSGFGQTVNFEDDFSDGDFTSNPTWTGDTNDFQIHSLNGNPVIRLSGSGASTSYLSTPSVNTVGYWEFFVRIDGTAPSGSNKAEIFLMSDIQDLTGLVNGYAVRVGETGNDVFRVVRYDSGSEAGIIVSDTTIVQSSSSYRVKVIRDNSGNWSIEVGEGYSGVLKDSGNTGTDNTYTTASYFGFKVDYTSSRTDDFYFDFKIDIPPVNVESLTTISDTEVDITFSRNIDFSTVQTSDFTLNPGSQTPSSATQQSSNTVRLNFASAFQGGENSITITGIDDASGETSLADTTLTFFIYDAYQTGDLVINEFMYDPPSGATEYVELRNTSARYLNIKNWKLGDNGAFNTITSDDFTIYPDSFVVLTDDETALTAYFGTGNYIEINSWRALNNSGTEQVRIRDENGVTIDSLEYTSDWGGDDVSLERRDPTVSATFKENWGDSPASNSGTPGFSNEIEGDVSSPEIEQFEKISDTQLLLIFSERIQQLPAETATNFSLSADNITTLPSLQTVQYLAPDSIILEYEDTFPSLAEGTTYELTIENQSDIFGNTTAQLRETFFVIEYTVADSGEVFITEFMFDPATGMTDFIELYNSTAQAINLENWTYNDNSSSPRIISSSEFTVLPGKRMVLAPDSSLFQLFPGISMVDMGSRFSNLNSTTSDDIVIRNAYGTLIDSLTYQPSWGGNEVSLERRSTDYSATFAENWENSPSENQATPGQPNLIPEDTFPPELEALQRISEQQIQLVFSERLQPLPAENTANFTLSANNISSLPSLQSATFSPPDTILLQFDAPLPSQPEGTSYELTISGQTDIFNNTSAPFAETFFVIEFGQADSGDVFITEFMFDPATGLTDFIELYNSTDEAFNLQNWTYNDNGGNPRSISSSEIIFSPNEYLVLAPDSSVYSAFPGIKLIAMGSRFANLNSTTEDAIVIKNESDKRIDSLTYTPAWGGDGVSLERRSIEITSVYQENWGNSPSENLATAGAPNEITADTSAPIIASAEDAGSTSLRIIFNERVQQIPAELLSNYELSTSSSDLTVPVLQNAEYAAPDTVLLRLESSLPREPDGTEYQLRVRNQADIFGNISDELTTDFFLINFAQSDSGEVFITEFMYDPPEEFSEFIELYNSTDSAFNLQNWTFNDNSGNQRVISDVELSLNPGKRIILTPDSIIYQNFEDIEFLALGSRFSSLNNSSDAIVIRNEHGTLIDSLSYSSDWGGDEVSLERRSTGHAPVYRENWGDSPAEQRATPSKVNQISPDIAPPDIQEVTVLNGDHLQLLFSERIQREQALNPDNYTLTSEDENLALPELDSLSFQAPDTVQLFYSNEFPFEISGTTYEIHSSNQTDIFGNSSGVLSSTFFLIKYAKPTPGDISINEFMYDPPEDFTEFIEVVNTSDSTLNLSGWTYNDNTQNRRVISDVDHAVAPGEYLILTADSTLAERFPNLNFIAMGSRFSSLNNSTDAIVIRDSSGVRIDSLTYSSNWGGNGVSLERKDTDFTAHYKENWGNSPAPELATPGNPNTIPPDETPPEISEIHILNDSTLQVIFTERLQPGPAELSSNYSLSVPPNFTHNVPELDSVVFFPPDTVRLYYPQGLPREEDGTTYGLIAKNQTDIFGNTTENFSMNFFLIDIGTASFGEVIINEFMYDPADNYSEFIELYNHSNQNFNLKNWTFNDNTGNPKTISPVTYELKLNDFVVLTPDSTLIHQFPQMPVIVMGSGFSSLNNSSDDIVIRNQDGTLIDSLTYFSDWGGESVSLERKDPTIESIFEENWGSSTNLNFATPGKPNSVAPDITPPVLENAFIATADTVVLMFDEHLKTAPATNPENISVSPSLPISEIIHQSSSITLALETPMADGQSYTFKILNQEDIFGNVLAEVTSILKYTELSEANPGEVIVNEILYRRASADSEEFIELFNQTDRNFDLSQWTFSDATSSATIPAGTQLLAGEYIVLTDKQSVEKLSNSSDVQFKTSNLNEANAEANRVYVPGFPSLNDNQDAVVIKDQKGTVIDSLFYHNSWGGNEPGVSLERKDPLSASNDASNWASSTSESGNSLGSVSTVFQPDEVAPEVIFARLRNDGRIFVAFSEFVRFNDTDILVNNEPVAITGYQPNDANMVTIGEDAFEANQVLIVTFSQVQDFRGNIARDLSVEVSMPLAQRGVVINEILYDPLANTDDNLPDQTEFVELYNRSEYAISLEGIFLHDEPDENQEVRAIYPVNSGFKWIPSGSYVVFYAEDEATQFSSSKLAKYFDMETVDERFFIRTNRSSLSLASSGDAVYLADSTGTIIDSVFYDESWQNPNLYDTKGVTLERIDPDGPSNDASNWSSSTRVSGGTPGEENTIFQLAGSGPENTGISFSPNPFSPDDDGFEDNLFINYKLDEPDYLLRIRIFDRYGRLVRKLADGRQAGFEGSLIWDGNMDNRSRNRVGIYIVLFEAYNSANGKNRTFKETVVIARKF